MLKANVLSFIASAATALCAPSEAAGSEKWILAAVIGDDLVFLDRDHLGAQQGQFLVVSPIEAADTDAPDGSVFSMVYETQADCDAMTIQSLSVESFYEPSGIPIGRVVLDEEFRTVREGTVESSQLNLLCDRSSGADRLALSRRSTARLQKLWRLGEHNDSVWLPAVYTDSIVVFYQTNSTGSEVGWFLTFLPAEMALNGNQSPSLEGSYTLEAADCASGELGLFVEESFTTHNVSRGRVLLGHSARFEVTQNTVAAIHAEILCNGAMSTSDDRFTAEQALSFAERVFGLD